VLALALPLVISTASWTVMNFIDRMFLLWHRPESMGAAMNAGMLHFTMICLPLGVVSYVNTFVAQYAGAGQPSHIGKAMWQAVRIGWIATPLYLLSIPAAPWVFRLAGHEPHVAELETLYFQAMAFAAGPTIMAAGFSAFFTGRGQTRTVMLVDTAAAVLNVALDYWWIFGGGGLPAMGIEGAAWATVTALWAKAGVYWWLVENHPERERFGIRTGRSYDPALMRRLWRFGGPSGLQMLVEVSFFTLFLLLIGRLGSDAMVTTTLAFNVNTVAFVPMLGLGIAVATMVGNRLGSNEPDLAARATWTSLAIAMIYMGTLAALYVATPDLFLVGFAAGSEPSRFAPLRATTIVLLRFVAAYCLFDALTLVFASAIKGAGDTRFVLFTTLVTSPLPVLIGWFGITFHGGGLIWSWWVITGWITVLGVVYLSRFLQGRWREMRVIEPELMADVDSSAAVINELSASAIAD
jgi:MATE family multidrug resistance protein